MAAEDTQAQAAQEAGEGQGQEPEETAGQGTQASPEDAATDAPQAGDDLVPKAELTKRNKENESLRKRLKSFEKQEEERRKEQLSQTDALQEENEGLKSQNETLLKQVKRWQFERALNLPDADLAWGMLGDLGLEVEWGENNVPQNIDEIRKTLKREKPRVWGNGSANGGERSEPPESTGGDFINQLFHSRGGNRQRARR